MVCLGAHAGNGAVTLIEGPDGVCAVGEEAWFAAYGDLQDGFVCGGINFAEEIVFGGGDPDEAVGEEGAE